MRLEIQKFQSGEKHEMIEQERRNSGEKKHQEKSKRKGK